MPVCHKPNETTMRTPTTRILFLCGLFFICFLYSTVWILRKGSPDFIPLTLQRFYNGENLSLDYVVSETSLVRNTTQQVPWHGKPTSFSNLPSNVSATKKKIHVILMSYMRSGSTFTGQLLHASPEVFYIYEPLLYTVDMDVISKNTLTKYRLIGTFRNDPTAPQVLDYVMTCLRCDFTANNLRFLRGVTYSRSFETFQKCKTASAGRANTDLCALDLKKRCEGKRATVAKVLRLKMWEIEKLLSADPELRVIHLVRDPRGIVVSRRAINYYLNPTTLCQRLNTDAQHSQLLNRKFPGRILTVRYEDLASHPVEVTKQMYQFSNLNWMEYLKENITQMTAPKNATFSEKKTGTIRKNSTATAFYWRNKIDYGSVLSIQRMCVGMMESYGYINFDSRTKLLDINSYPSMLFNYSNAYFKAQYRTP